MSMKPLSGNDPVVKIGEHLFEIRLQLGEMISVLHDLVEAVSGRDESRDETPSE